MTATTLTSTGPAPRSRLKTWLQNLALNQLVAQHLFTTLTILVTP
jgi:hypothetical protein